MSVWDRKPHLPTITALRPSSLGSGLATFGSFAPDDSMQNIDIDTIEYASDFDALAGDWRRIGEDMRTAVEAAHGQKAKRFK